MNKRMREILAKIQAKTAEAKQLTAKEDKAAEDLDKAAALLDEVDALQKEYELEERAYTAEKRAGGYAANAAATDPAQPETEPQEKRTTQTGAKDGVADSVRGFAKAVRSILQHKSLVEGVDEDGGYTVPEDIRTQIEHWADVDYSLLSDIDVVQVTTNKGARTYQKRGEADVFVDLDENGAITNEITAPQFERVTYAIQDRAGFMPVSNDLVADSDANITAIIADWLGKANVATSNAKILEIINKKAPVKLNGLEGIKKVVNVDLGQAYKGTTKIITNDDGLNYLDTLVDTNNRPMLNPDPTDSARLTLRCGTVVVPIKVIPNKILASENTYTLTADKAIEDGKTYYVASGDTYIAVESPDVAQIASYYELTASKVPMIIGDLKAGIRKWDRQWMSIKASDVASIGSFNAYAQNMTLFRAILRDDYTEMDTKAYKRGYVALGE